MSLIARPSSRRSARRLVYTLILLLVLGAILVVYRVSKDQLNPVNGEFNQEVSVGGSEDDAVTYFKSAFHVDIAGDVLHVWFAGNLLHTSHWYLIRMTPSTYASVLAAIQRMPDHADPRPDALELAPDAPTGLKTWWTPPGKNVVNGHTSPPYFEYFDLEYDPARQLLYFQTEI